MAFKMQPGTLYVKNPSLKKRVYKSMTRYDRLASKYYRRGDLKKGRKYELKSDRIYDSNYYKIFGFKKR